MTTTHALHSGIACACFVLGIGGVANGVSAGEADDAKRTHSALPEQFPQRKVRFGDLNLSERSDAIRLYRRLERAAKEVCQVSAHVLLDKRVRQCRSKALADAVHAIDAPELTAYYNSRSGTKDEPKRYAEAASSSVP